MPELHPDLSDHDLSDQDLSAARRDLLAGIAVPELDVVRRRALALRRRRRAAAGVIAALLLFVGTGAALAGGGWLTTTGVDVGATGSPTSQPTPPAAPEWRGVGVTVLGLNGPVLDLAGELRDVQFADRLLGYALAADCRSGGERRCAVRVAVTTDGGRSWTDPGWLETHLTNVAPAEMPSLLSVGSRVMLIGPDSWYVSDRTWGFTQTGTRATPLATVPAGARLWVPGASGDACAPGPIEVWLPDGWLAHLASQPAMDVCRVAPQPTASGAWWVGGRAGGRPAVGVSRDAGRSWQVTTLPAASPDAWAQVSTLGSDTFVTVVHRRGGDPYPETLTIEGVHRSAQGGPFTPYAGVAGTTLVGDVLPALDGGLVAAGPGWQISTGPGRGFAAPPAGSLPWVHRLRRTPGAWVAHDILGTGWAAISYDGTTWQKINLH